MHVALISIGNCPSLALRNLKQYAQAHPDLREQLEIAIYDYDIREFQASRIQSAQRWSFVTKFDHTLRELTRTKPRVVAFSCYMWNVDLSVHLAHLIKRLLPQTMIVLGGPDPGPRAGEMLRLHPHIDVIVDGDGEIPFTGILRALLGSSELSGIPQLRFRRSGEIVVTPASPELPDLSLLRNVYQPVPTKEEMGRWVWPYLLYETQRGCPYSCSYCMYGKTKVSSKDPEVVVDELTALLQLGIDVELIDPTFSTNVARAKQILSLLSKRSYDGRLYFEAYPDSIDEEMADLFVGARVYNIGIGFQTMSAEGLRAVSRPRNLRKFERAVRLLSDRGIDFYVDVIYGMPQTTVDDFLQTVDYVYATGVKRIVVYRLLGLPGSPLLDDVDKHALVFATAPPYELLQSSTFTLEELIYCEQFTETCLRLMKRVDPSMLATLARLAGGLSSLVTGLLKRGFSLDADAAALTSILADMMREGSSPARQPDEGSPARALRSLPVVG